MKDETLKEHFNTVATGADYSSYEDRRWNANPKVAVQHAATEDFVTGIAVPMTAKASRITELGAGPGTWTKTLNVAAPSARFMLLDISGEMLERAKRALPAGAQVETMEGDFVTLSLPAAGCDLFFSSRAIEYVTPKDTAVSMIMNHVAPRGNVCLITKMPKPLLNRLSGRTEGTIHRMQITPGALRELARASGGTNIRLYPVTFSFPLLRSAAADRFLGTIFGRTALSPVSAFFAESYALTCTKP